MFPYKKYLVKESDHFDPQQFSFFIDDLADLQSQTRLISPAFKTEIIMSCLKNQGMAAEWMLANPALTRLVESGTLSTGNLSGLFESSQANLLFRQQMEDYIKKGLAE